MIPVCEPVLDGNEERYVLDCLKSNWISSSGRYIPAFEERFSAYCGTRHGIACSSGTAALHLALAALKIGPGDEVIVPSFTLIVAANTVLLTGATPVLVDVDPKTWGMDPARIAERLTARTKAIMAVHMYGHPCDMDPILELAGRHGCAVIEDASEAHGAEYKGRKVGSLGDAGCFSFYGNKIITTGEGGMVVTNREDLAARARMLRNQAFGEPRFVHQEIGFNYRMTNLQAAIGLAQCERIKEKVERKRDMARQYHRLLNGSPHLTLPPEASWAKNVYWMYGVLLRDSFGRARDEVMRLLHGQGVETRAFFHPLHKQPALNGRLAPAGSNRFPVSEELGARGLYLPSGLGLTTAQIEEVTARLLACAV
jgi:perosamine synthetase